MCSGHPILYHRKSAFLVTKSTSKLKRAQIGGGLQVPVAIRATECEHVVIRRQASGASEENKNATKALLRQFRPEVSKSLLLLALVEYTACGLEPGFPWLLHGE
jgi:hypothetical protein